MKVALSTAAAPGLAAESLVAFDEACRRRGLDGLELVLGSASGGPDADPERPCAAARAAGLRVVALAAARVDAATAPALARAAASLEVPVSVPGAAVPEAELAAVGRAFARAGGRLLLAHGSALDAVLALLAAVRAARTPALGLAWEVRPSSESLDERGAILLAARAELGLVRFFGGGPEQHDQGGRGVGSFFHELALSRYDGPLVLHPSGSAALPRWSRWLASHKSAGCGHGHDARAIALDVRDVEPRDRLDTVLGAYRALGPGATLELTLDHDPSCMYYTLRATEEEGSFAFRTVGHGPEVWRAEVTKRGART
ncbi:MAG: DUF2249 domain-containing protein [Polyangiaceae bacterium]|nr:DUF2249 domain-containing protein [Polyangiaceae bacterium]